MPLTEEQKQEIDDSIKDVHETRRPTVVALEQRLGHATRVLDHGFVRVIDYMGDDAAIVQAARVSYGRGTKKTSEDKALISYLMRHRHSTPFEMCEIKLHVKAPIFVFRQWLRHRTASVNEYSARYSILDREFYIPLPEHLAAQSSANRQGRAGVLSGTEAETVLSMLRDDASRNYEHYEWMLNEDSADPHRAGLARELARINLTLNTMSQMYWKVDLHNLLGFLSLRAGPHAQWEIRTFAEVILDIVEAWVPMTFDAFRNHRMEAFTLSGQMVETVRRAIAGEKVNARATGMSKRDWDEMVVAFPALASR